MGRLGPGQPSSESEQPTRKETLLSKDRDYTDYTDYVEQKDEGDDVEAHAAAARVDARDRVDDPERVDAAEEPPDVEGHLHHPKVD